MPIISVVIPAYNAEKTIQATIESVLKQTFTDFELIVINDGSTDTTLDILNNIPDPRLKVFSYPNGGLPKSRNRGIDHASGECISFIDADDLWTLDKLELQLKALQENPQAGVAYSWTDLIDKSGKFFRRGGYSDATGNVYTRLFLADFVESGSNPLIRKQAFNEVGKFDESLSNAHDWEMWLRLASRYEFVVVESRQIFYRIYANSMSSNVWGMEQSSLQIIEKAVARSPEVLGNLKKPCLANRYKYLSFKALDGFPERRRGLAALRFLWQAIINDPKLLQQRRFILKVLFKIAAMIILPPQQAEKLIARFKTLPSIQRGFLDSMRVDPAYL